MKRVIFPLFIALLAFNSCDQTDPKTPIDDVTVTEPTTGVKHLVDPHPELAANADSMQYTYPRAAKNGFYLVNRKSGTPVDVLPVEAYEKLFSAFKSCASGDQKYMAIDRRKPALVDSIQISVNGDHLTLSLEDNQDGVNDFMERFSEEDVAFVINEQVIYQTKGSHLKGVTTIKLNCLKEDAEEIQEMIDNTLTGEKDE